MYQKYLFSSKFLKIIRKNHPKITFSYIVLVDNNQQPIAFASIKIVDFYLGSIKTDLEFLKNIGRKLHLILDKKTLKLLTCGNTFISGEHGVFIKENQNKKAIIKELAESINHFVNSDKKLKKQLDLLLLKDFEKESLFFTEGLKKFNYHPFSVAPNMRFLVHDGWLNFDDYLASMKTKFRIKARKAFQQSENICIKEVTLKNIEQELPRMTALYEKVAANADFNLGFFNFRNLP